MNYFIIGSYTNEQHQIYSTVIALCNNVVEATSLQKKLKGELFIPHGKTRESKEEIDELSVNADIWNQIDIVKLSDF